MDQQGKRIRLDGRRDRAPTSSRAGLRSHRRGCRRRVCARDRDRRPRRRCRHRDEDLAFFTCAFGVHGRRALQHRPECGDRTGCRHRQQLQNPEQRFGLQGRHTGRRSFLRSLDGFHQHLQPAGGNPQNGPGASDAGEKGATIGANATIVCGTTLGRNSFVGAGAVVTRNVPDHALVVGNPAKQIGWMCVCGERLSDDLECLACGNAYRKATEGLILKKSTIRCQTSQIDAAS